MGFVMEGESVLAVVSGLQGQAGTLGAPRVYDVVLTNRRIVAVSKANLTGALIAGGLLGGVVGGLVAGAAAGAITQGRGAPGGYDPATLDTLVSRQKGSFALRFDQVERAKFTGLFGNFLKMHADGKKYYLKVPGPQRQYFRDFFSNVAGKNLP